MKEEESIDSSESIDVSEESISDSQEPEVSAIAEKRTYSGDDDGDRFSISSDSDVGCAYIQKQFEQLNQSCSILITQTNIRQQRLGLGTQVNSRVDSPIRINENPTEGDWSRLMAETQQNSQN